MQRVITTDHEAVMRWANERGGMPAIVAGTEADLRFDWGEGDENLMRLSWEEFFDVFEAEGLAFAHIEDDDSSVYEFVPRGSAAQDEDR